MRKRNFKYAAVLGIVCSLPTVCVHIHIARHGRRFFYLHYVCIIGTGRFSSCISTTEINDGTRGSFSGLKT